jgi:uncharacterized membrane protein YjjP (DUF1212 family)
MGSSNMGDTGRHQPDRSRPAVAASVDDLLLLAATLLFVDGQTTQRTIEATERLAVALGVRARLLPRWGELTLCIDDAGGARVNTVAADPVGVDMGKVAATTAVLEQLCDGRIDQETAVPALQAIKAGPPVSLARFALLAAAGAAALGVIFGATHWLSLVLIALSAGVGGCLRRFLAGLSHNPFIQPFCAALLAGVVGAVAARLQLSSLQLLVAVCPCMVLVPGPHLLNGAIDLGRARIALGAARMGYAFLVIAMICSGLLLGLALGGTSPPRALPSPPTARSWPCRGGCCRSRS